MVAGHPPRERIVLGPGEQCPACGRPLRLVGEVLADAMTLIETAKMSGLNPEAYLTDILARINDHTINRLDDLLKWNWRAANACQTAAA
ncbi:IS66 C-terminal element [Rhodospira trueperi]|uniref:IS66 C-terminal element n=1 Tax=Rhodospira trueperi TaxID=69960 RepID=A0A1G7EXA5_9PROT|nr:IS66 C-terminal element [Rhodospira trueperi]